MNSVRTPQCPSLSVQGAIGKLSLASQTIQLRDGVKPHEIQPLVEALKLREVITPHTSKIIKRKDAYQQFF